MLRPLGATVSKGFVCKPRVTIEYAWFLEIGDHVLLGEMVWIRNHTTVRICKSVCINQSRYLFPSNHEWNDPAFPLFCALLDIDDGCWVGAGVSITPGPSTRCGTAFMINL